MALGRLIVIVAVVAAPCAASAQDDEERARALFTQGVEQMTAGEYDAALRSFERSLAIEPRVATEVNIATTLGLAGRLVEAVERYESILAGAPDLPDDQRSDLQSRLDATRAVLPTLTFEDGSVEVVVEIDGEVVTTIPPRGRSTHAVDPGPHRVRFLSRDGSRVTERNLTLERSEHRDVRPTLPPAPEGTRRDPPPVEPDDDGGDAGWWVLGIGVGAAAVAAVIVSIVVLTRDSDGPYAFRVETLSEAF